MFLFQGRNCPAYNDAPSSLKLRGFAEFISFLQPPQLELRRLCEKRLVFTTSAAGVAEVVFPAYDSLL